MKKHRGLLICLGVLLILGIVSFFALKSLFYPDGSKNKYGDRLNGIEEHQIKQETFNEMKETFLKNEKVVDFNYNITGKIIKVFVKVKEDTKVDNAKELSDIIVKNLSEEDKKFYDILYYITSEGENALYPVLGSKHKNSEIFSWTIKIDRPEEDKKDVKEEEIEERTE